MGKWGAHPNSRGSIDPKYGSINLLAGLASGEVVMGGDKLKHLPSISKSLETIWDTAKRRNTVLC